MSSATQDIPAGVVEVLALPALGGLTEAQTRGAVCVWHGGERLTAETAVDLGEQTHPERWFPRGCRDCVAERAHSGLFAHCATCTDCTKAAGTCDIGRGLYRLVREYRR